MYLEYVVNTGTTMSALRTPPVLLLRHIIWNQNFKKIAFKLQLLPWAKYRTVVSHFCQNIIMKYKQCLKWKCFFTHLCCCTSTDPISYSNHRRNAKSWLTINDIWPSYVGVPKLELCVVSAPQIFVNLPSKADCVLSVSLETNGSYHYWVNPKIRIWTFTCSIHS